MLSLKKPNVKLNLSKREKILASLFLLLAAFFLYYQYVFAVQEKNIAAIKNDIKSKEDMINQLTSQGYGDVSQLTVKIQEMDTEIEKFYEKIPNIANMPGLLVDFYKSAKKNNVSAQTITFGKLEVKDSYSSFLVSLDVLGTKSDVFNFIKEIEGYPRLSKISKIEFEPKEGNMILAKISDEFYVLNEVKADPLEYPFMDGQKSVGFVLDLFNQEEVAGVTAEIDQAGNIIVRNNGQTQRAGSTGGYTNDVYLAGSFNSKKTPSTVGNESKNEGAVIYPWIKPVDN